jgi:hypothetical protein
MILFHFSLSGSGSSWDDFCSVQVFRSHFGLDLLQACGMGFAIHRRKTWKQATSGKPFPLPGFMKNT